MRAKDFLSSLDRFAVGARMKGLFDGGWPTGPDVLLIS
jgi:hypothetical protein